MKLHLDADRLPAIKRRLREAFPSSKPSVRIEAFARGIDFKTHAALLSALQNGPLSVELNDTAFEQYFIAHSVQPAPRTFRRAVIRACIEPLLKTNLRLTTHGYGVPDSYGGSGPLYTEEMAPYVKDSALCGLGQTAPNPVLTTLRYFRHEYEEHIIQRKCHAGTCTAMVTYGIDPETCIGCGLCAKKCPQQCITGEKKKPHVIDTEACIKCGVCMDSCKFDAVKYV